MVDGLWLRFYESKSLADAHSYNTEINASFAYYPYYGQPPSIFTIPTGLAYSKWAVSSISDSVIGIDPAATYSRGDVLSLNLDNGSTYAEVFFYPAPPPSRAFCFKEDTKILCLKDDKEVEVKIQDLRPATLVKTVNNGYMKVTVVSKSILNNPAGSERVKDKLYKCSKEKYPELSEDLYITGCHSILVNTVSLEQQEKIKATFGRLYITSNKYRLMAMIDERAEPCVEPGKVAIYHFALDNDELCYNYGVYANGLLVESCNTKDIMSRKDMVLLE